MSAGSNSMVLALIDLRAQECGCARSWRLMSPMLQMQAAPGGVRSWRPNLINEIDGRYWLVWTRFEQVPKRVIWGVNADERWAFQWVWGRWKILNKRQSIFFRAQSRRRSSLFCFAIKPAVLLRAFASWAAGWHWMPWGEGRLPWPLTTRSWPSLGSRCTSLGTDGRGSVQGNQARVGECRLQFRGGESRG